MLKKYLDAFSGLRQWNKQGYLIMRGALSDAACDAINADVTRLTGAERGSPGSAITIDVLHGRHTGRLLKAGQAPSEAFEGPFKINNFFVESASIRNAMFDRTVTRTLKNILSTDPMAINSLNFVWGSQQPPHIDSWYMPPPKDNSMAVVSLCLEDVHPEAGPLFYYPGSHKIPPYRFSHGGIHAIDSEMDACRAYIDDQIAKGGYQRETFEGRKGDVFIWHCQLLHGGSPILDPRRTRRSLVAHFWGAECVDRSRIKSFQESGHYLDRDYYINERVEAV